MAPQTMKRDEPMAQQTEKGAAPQQAPDRETEPRRIRDSALVLAIARRELTQQLTNKAFWMSVAITAIMMAVTFGATSYFQGSGGERLTVVLTGQQNSLAPALRPHAEVSTAADAAAARAAVDAGRADAAVLDGPEGIVVQRELPEELGRLLQEAHRAVVLDASLRRHGLSEAEAAQAAAVPPLPTTTLDPDAVRTLQRTTTAATAVFILFMLMLVSGLAVAQGVAEEKSSRIAEVLLAKVRARHLLAGKIIGLGASALVQILVLATACLGAAVAFGLFEAPADAVGAGLNVLLWFIPGYVLFVTLYAVAGSLVSRPEDVNHVVGPVNGFQMLGLLGPGLALAGSTDSATVEILSLVPGVSWAAMPVRMAYEDVPWWQIGTAFALTLVTAAVLIRIGGRIYAGGLLQHGGIVKVKDALRGARL
ncbi:ABC transporter permease [Streptomyces sp. NPDC006283]|uniref:ABC transporter permease n=1 Tax=Streptomyces sp. NPDC006283 TaxID=3156741 RepID=UPI0033B29E3C